MKKLLGVVFLLIAGLAVMVGLPVEAQAAPHFYLDPASGSYKVGDKVVITAWVDPDGKDIQTMDLIINYDKTRLSITQSDIKDENYFSPYNASVFNVDEASGKLSLYVFSTQGTYSKNTKGKVVTMTFTAKAAGTAPVVFICGGESGSAIRNADSNLIDCNSNGSGSYTVAAADQAAAATPTPSDNNSSQNTPSPTLPAAGSSLPGLAGLSVATVLISLGVAGLLF